MIHWMLSQLERNPTAAFYEKDLIARSPEALEQAKRDRLLQRLPHPLSGDATPYYHRGLRRSYTVIPRDDGVLEAFDPEDPEAEPIELSPSDLVQWTLDRDRLALKFQEINGLTGQPEALDDRLHFLGEAGEEDGRVAFVLGLLQEPASASMLLSALPSLLPSSYRLIAVACPTFLPAPTELTRLAKIRVTMFPMAPDDPLHLPSPGELTLMAVEQPSAESFQHSPDYRSVKWRGQQFAFSPARAAVIKMLHKAYLAGTPDLAWNQISGHLEGLGNYPERMRDVFRRSPAWGTLVIKGNTHSTYRLDL